MALYPIKVLLDKDRNVFIPFLPANAIPINGTDETVAGALENRYTKNEVDNIIKSLGTLQVLRGRVNTYEDLLAIENPRAGDVYIVGTSDTENSEYMYIGNTWERLGPMIDLSNLVTIEDLVNRLGAYATITYVENLINSRPVLESETSAAMTGEALNLAILNKTLKDGDVIACTSDHLNFKTGHMYLINEGVRGPVSITEQLEALGFTVNISNTLESNNNKYYYIVKRTDGKICAAYSQVQLDTSRCDFPDSGWRTFSVVKKSTEDPKFYYNNDSDNAPVLSNAITGAESSSLSNSWIIQFSTAVEATYSNDPTATAFTYYSAGEDELILKATDLTQTQTDAIINYVDSKEPDLSNYYTKAEVDAKKPDLSGYYTKSEVDAIVKNIVEQLQYTPTSQDISNLSIILGEDASTVEYTSSNSSVNYKLDNIIGGNK